MQGLHVDKFLIVSGYSLDFALFLCRFLNQHPHAETASIMSKLSPDFYAFLEKGLRRIDRRDDTGQHQPCSYTSTLLIIIPQQ